MEIRVLRYFLALAQENSVSAAAAFLHVTQPTLSRQLIEMEKELGVKLFNRGKRTITLTEEGVILRKRAEEIIQLVEKTEGEVSAGSESISGNIYIGAAESPAMHLLGKVIQTMQKKHDQVCVHIFSGNAEDVTERLDQGLLDFGLLIQPANIGKYKSFCLPIKDRWGVLMQRSCPLSSHEVIFPEDLWGLPLICSRQRLVNGDIGKWMQRNYQSLHLVATYNLIYNAAVMVEQGIGYALALDGLINTTGKSPLCFRPLGPSLEVEVHLVWKKQQLFSKAAASFLKQVQQTFSQVEN